MPRTRFVFWQGQPSPHQSNFLRALAASSPEAEVLAIFENSLEQKRIGLGWHSPDLTGVNVRFATRQMINDVVSDRSIDSVHIFSGFRLPLAKHALKACIRTDALVGIMSESRSRAGVYGSLRVAHSLVAERRFRAGIDFVLAIGSPAIDWYKYCGYSTSKLALWAYFVEPVPVLLDTSQNQKLASTDFSIAYVGRCVRSKGVDLLLSALSEVADSDWRLFVVGDGPDRPRLEKQAAKLGLKERVIFLGVAQNELVRSILDHCDLLALPSYGDGWGAVINEALMAGVPVVCTDQCGGADLIVDSQKGDVFPAGDGQTLLKILKRWIKKGPLTGTERQKIRTWSKCLRGEVAAQYFKAIVTCIEGGTEIPPPPWDNGPQEHSRSSVLSSSYEDAL